MAIFILFNSVLLGLVLGLFAPVRPLAKVGLGCAIVIAGLALAGLAVPSPRALLLTAMSDRPASDEPVALARRFHDHGAFDADSVRRARYHRMAVALRRSNAIEDARADIAAGEIGLMATAMFENGSPQSAPGLYCSWSGGGGMSPVARLSHMTVGFGRIREKLGQIEAADLFYAYATGYNRYVFSNTRLRHEGCQLRRRVKP